MPRLAFAQRPMINRGAQPLFQLGFAEQAEAFHAKLFILIAPGLEFIHLVGFWNGMHIAPGEIAIDFVLLDALLQQGLRIPRRGRSISRHRTFPKLVFNFCCPEENPVQTCPPLRPEAPYPIRSASSTTTL